MWISSRLKNVEQEKFAAEGVERWPESRGQVTPPVLPAEECTALARNTNVSGLFFEVEMSLRMENSSDLAIDKDSSGTRSGSWS